MEYEDTVSFVVEEPADLEEKYEAGDYFTSRHVLSWVAAGTEPEMSSISARLPVR